MIFVDGKTPTHSPQMDAFYWRPYSGRFCRDDGRARAGARVNRRNANERGMRASQRKKNGQLTIPIANNRTDGTGTAPAQNRT